MTFDNHNVVNIRHTWCDWGGNESERHVVVHPYRVSRDLMSYLNDYYGPYRKYMSL